MIKYLELTAPDDELFRQAKIVSVEVSEGERIFKGSTLFSVKVGRKKYDLPSTLEGKVTEIIASVGENITLSTALLLVETEVKSSTASKPINTQQAAKNHQAPESTSVTAAPSQLNDGQPTTAKSPVKHEQQSLDLDLFESKSVKTQEKTAKETPKEQQPDSTSENTPDIKPKSETMSANSIIKVAVPDIGADSAKVIDIIVSVGDSVSVEESLITLESDKASMDVPSTHEGVVKAISVSLDQDVSEGTVIVEIEAAEGSNDAPAEEKPAPAPAKQEAAAPKGSQASSGMGIEPIPAQDFSKFGEIEVQELNKIKRLTASNLHRSWLNVPHVTHNDESNINDLEAFRKTLNAEYAKQKKDIKLSPLAFIVKAVVNALQTYPQFNSSLEPGGENLILKKYYNIGIAVETPNGLVVPVIKDADKLSVAEIAKEMGNLAAKARDKKLSMADMSGACFTISSLGGIGGTNFTPIVNAPEVAILGVARSKVQPVWNGSDFEPGMILPLSLSYD